MNLHDIYLAAQLAKNDNSGTDVDLSDYYTKSQTDGLISGKVDKVSDRGLSTNDFTNADKSKLDGLENYDDTDVKTDISTLANEAAINRSTLRYQAKNLFKVNAKNSTLKGITVSVNEDGTVKVNGTATEKIIINLGNFSVSEDCILTGSPTGASATTYYLGIPYVGYEFGSGLKVPAGTSRNIQIEIISGATLNNLVFKPMIRYAEITDDTYEPYKPSVAEYITSLEERIAALEGRT